MSAADPSAVTSPIPNGATRFLLRSIRQLLLDHDLDPLTLRIEFDEATALWIARLRGRVIGQGGHPAQLRASVQLSLGGFRRWHPSRLLSSWAEAYGE